MTTDDECRRFAFDGGLVFRDDLSGRIWLLEGELAEASRALDDDDVIATLASLQTEWSLPAAIPGSRWQPPNRAPELELCLSDGDRVVRARIWEPTMAPVLAAMLAPIVVDEADPDSTLDLFAESGATVLARDGIVLQAGEGIGWWLLIRWLSRELRSGRSWLAVLHAATIVPPGSDDAIVLAGVSGSGKTTLAGALIARDARLLADDATPIESTSRLAWPCPLAMGVKSGSWSLFDRLFGDIGHLPILPFGSRSIRYVPAPRVEPDTGYPVAALIFPKWREGAAFTAERIAPIAALRRLAESGAIPADEAPELAEFLAWLEVVPAWSLVYGDLADAIPFVERLAKSSRDE